MGRLVDNSGRELFEGVIEGGRAYVQDADPGAVGAGSLWLDTTTTPVSVPRLLIRNEGDDGWLPVPLVAYTAGPPESFAEVSFDENSASVVASNITTGQTAALLLSAAAASRITCPGPDGFRLGDSAAELLGFFGTGPVAQPVVPLTAPTVQNVITALVALGLVAQHD